MRSGKRHEKQYRVSRTQRLHADAHAYLTGGKVKTTRSLSPSPRTEPRLEQGLARGLTHAQDLADTQEASANTVTIRLVFLLSLIPAMADDLTRKDFTRGWNRKLTEYDGISGIRGEPPTPEHPNLGDSFQSPMQR